MGKSQIDKFREAARERGADTSDAEFDRTLREIARPDSDEAKRSRKLKRKNGKGDDD